MRLALFVLLLGVFAGLAARPQLRNGIRWGKSSKAPLSVVGYYGSLAGLLLIFVAPFAASYLKSDDWMQLIYVGFAVFMLAGAYDLLRDSGEGR